MAKLPFSFTCLRPASAHAAVCLATILWLMHGLPAHAQAGSARTLDFVPVQLDVQVEPRTLMPFYLLVHGHHLYSPAWTNSEGCLTITDLSDPLYPKLVALHPLGNDLSAAGLIVLDDLLYISGTNITVLDISTPARPEVVTTFKPAKPAQYFATRDHFLFVAEKGGMEIFDVSNPKAPASISTLDLEGNLRFNIALYDSIAYVSGRTNLHLVDITDPWDPKLRKTIQLATSNPPSIGDMEVYNDILYVAAGTYGLVLFDISNPLEPVRLESPNLASFNVRPEHRSLTALQRWDDLLFAATLYGGVVAFDISTSSNPTVSGHLQENRQLAGLTRGIAQYDRRIIALLEADLASLQVLDVVDSGFIPLTTYSSDGRGISSGVALTEEMMAFAGISLYSAPIALLPSMVVHSNYVLNSSFPQLLASSNRLITLAATQLKIHEFQSDGSISLLGSSEKPYSPPADLALSGEYLLLAGTSGLIICEPFAPGGPTNLASYGGHGRISGVAAQTPLTALATVEGVTILDISDVRAPIELAAIPLTRTTKVALEDNLLAVAHTTNRLSVYSISNPRSPALLSHVRTRSTPIKMLLSKGQLYLGYYPNGFEVFDLQSLPLTRIGGNSVYSVSDLAVNQQYLLVGTGSEVHIFRRPPPLPPRLVNPLFQGSEFSFELNKPIAAPFILEESSDLMHWQEHSTINPGAGRLYILEGNPAPNGRYFRIMPE